MKALKTKKWKLGYRVCLKQGARWVSTYMGREIWRTGWKVYAIGRITKRRAGYGPLAVFDSEKEARSFMGNNMYGSYKLFRCRYIQSDDTQYWMPHYHGGFNPKRYCQANVSGKRFADAVELISEVTR